MKKCSKWEITCFETLLQYNYRYRHKTTLNSYDSMLRYMFGVVEISDHIILLLRVGESSSWNSERVWKCFPI